MCQSVERLAVQRRGRRTNGFVDVTPISLRRLRPLQRLVRRHVAPLCLCKRHHDSPGAPNTQSIRSI
jgi:hypothetical protein